MNECLKNILVCPVTGEALNILDKNRLDEINKLISEKSLRHFESTPVKRILNAGFISQNQKYAYRFEEGVAFLLKDLAIVLDEHDANFNAGNCKVEEKTNVQNFYDQLGWKKNEDGQFIDTQKFVDTRSVCQDYFAKCQLRIGKHLKPKGKYILDAGCGPIPKPERLDSQGEFDIRICTDISFLALQNARKSLKDSGVYLLCDNTNLPLKADLVDAAVCLHNIYHIPEDEQKTAIEEIARVLKPGSSAAIAYSWGKHSVLMKLAFLLLNLGEATVKRLRKVKSLFTNTTKLKSLDKKNDLNENQESILYFHAHNYKYFTNQKWNFKFEVKVLRSISKRFTDTYIRKWLLGKQLLVLIYWLEELCPRTLGRLGQYPLFIIRK